MYGNKSSPRRRRAPKIIQYHLLTQQETGQNAKMAFPEQSQHEGSVNYFNNREKGGANVFVREIEREIKEIEFQMALQFHFIHSYLTFQL